MREHAAEECVADLGIRGSAFAATVLKGGKVLLHVRQGTGFVRIHGKMKLTFPAGQGVLFDPKTKTFKQTLAIPAGAIGAALPAPSRRSRESRHPPRGRSVLMRNADAKQGTKRIAFGRTLRPGRYTVEVAATARGFTGIATAPLR